MKRSSLLLILTLAVLVIVYLIMSQTEKRSLSEKQVGNFLGVDSGLVNKIAVRKFGSAIEFEKRGEQWHVIDRGKAYPAERGTVEQIANLAHAMKVGEVISSNPEKQMLFQVDTLTGSTVTYYRDANELASIVVGKIGADYQTTYARKPGSDEVYAAVGNFARLFSRPASGYRDKIIMTLDTTMITTIACRGKEIDYRIVRRDTLWQVEPTKGEPFTANPQKMSGLLRQLTNVRCNDFVAEGDTARPDFAQPTAQIDISLADGSVQTLGFVEQGGETKNYYARATGMEDVFIVAEYVVTNLVKKVDDLK